MSACTVSKTCWERLNSKTKETDMDQIWEQRQQSRAGMTQEERDNQDMGLLRSGMGFWEIKRRREADAVTKEYIRRELGFKPYKTKESK